MKVAISTDGQTVSAHFGRCPSYTVLEIRDGKITKSEEIPNPGHHPGYLPRFFHEMNVNCIIAGGMGARASELFSQYSIQPILGISGGESLCRTGAGKGYGIDKTECDHDNH